MNVENTQQGKNYKINIDTIDKKTKAELEEKLNRSIKRFEDAGDGALTTQLRELFPSPKYSINNYGKDGILITERRIQLRLLEREVPAYKNVKDLSDILIKKINKRKLSAKDFEIRYKQVVVTTEADSLIRSEARKCRTRPNRFLSKLLG